MRTKPARLTFLAVFFFGIMTGYPLHANPKPLGLWIMEFKDEARKQGISASLLEQAFAGFEINPRIIELDRKQPEGTTSFSDYLAKVVTDARAREGRELYVEHKKLLDEVAAKYGVPAQYIVALWGIETSYGKVTGGFNVPHALATLAYEGRRAEFFRDELMKSLQIIQQGHIRFEQMKGSWAGAMGQSQFMPSSFLSFAVDHNGDGKRDIWGTKADIFASIAHYLSKSGWKQDVPWGQEVTLPRGFDKKLEDIKTFRSLQFWQDKGVAGVGGKSLAASTPEAALIFPGKDYEGAYLIYSNYPVLLKWNRSRYFATSVGMLADRIAHGK